jgi:hypothetical protein
VYIIKIDAFTASSPITFYITKKALKLITSRLLKIPYKVILSF